MGKQNGPTGKARERKAQRRAEAVERQEAWAALTPTEKLQLLDSRLGKGKGAVKQRKRITVQL